MVEWLRAQWFLLTALVAVGVAWGTEVTRNQDQAHRIDTLEQIVIKGDMAEQKAKIERVDERTLNIQKQLERQFMIQQQILEELRDR